MEPFEVEREVLGHPIRVTVLPCGEDLSITIRGGARPHVGSVTVARNGEIVSEWVGDSHRDDVVGDRFAVELSRMTGGTASTACGIHYDGLSKTELAVILNECEQLLEKAKEKLK